MDEVTTSVNRPRGLWAKVSLSFPDDPKVIEAGHCAELAYLRCTLLSKQHMTDGVVHRARAPRWLVGIPGDPVEHMDTLVRVGLMEATDDGWRIPEAVWCAWNLTAEEMAEQSDNKRAAAKKGNHVKYHVNKGKIDPDCPLCIAESSQNARSLRAVSSHDARTSLAKASPETETETEKSREEKTTTNPGGGVHVKQIALDAAAMLMEHEPRVERPAAWKAKVSERLLATHDVDALARTHGTEAAARLYQLERPEMVTPSFDPDAELRTALAFGRAVRQQHADNYGENEQAAMRESFLSELPYESRDMHNPEAWCVAAKGAYDTYVPTISQRRPA